VIQTVGGWRHGAATVGTLRFGVDFSTVRDVALAVVVGAIVLAAVFAVIIKALVSKLVVIGVFVALAAVVWQQRGSVEDCAGSVRQTLAEGARDSTTCTFFGRDVTVDSPLG
jgi:hypothetical protein